MGGTKDLSGFAKGAMLAVATVLAGATIVAVARVLIGVTPSTYEAKQVAVLIHLSSVLPAIPLGLWVLLARKGDATHKLLGRIWGVLMLVAAGSAIFIRNMNHGQFGWIHLFVPLVFVTLYRAVRAARAGDIAAHKRHMWGMYAGALLLPGLFAFLPGRLLWNWLML
ncbi:DUF2306 domain-containing protein [Sphingomonas sp. NIBR02145]|jgi:uncharacterized membrane protein|nr:DUF2306 domain-containing protein [Sphingomonas sp. NIBR02145]WHU01373.1 DUF2306 domain-containing protein [Sphingomonas sp. NIBR02145]